MSKLFPRPQIVYRNGRPNAVILGLPQYERLLEKIEDMDDLKEIRRLRRTRQKFIPLETYLARHH